MKTLPKKSYVKVIKCSENRHNGKDGHIHSRRLDGRYNIKLKNNEHCVALEVKLIVKARRRLKKPYEIVIPQQPKRRLWIMGLLQNWMSN